jgi:glc operon protein GlcG
MTLTLTLAEAHRIIEGAIAQAQELKAEISVTVCDANGRLIALNRMDGAFAESNRGSIGKAIASAATGRSSGEAEASVDFSLRTGTVIGEGAPIIRRRGGLPTVDPGAKGRQSGRPRPIGEVDRANQNRLAPNRQMRLVYP